MYVDSGQKEDILAVMWRDGLLSQINEFLKDLDETLLIRASLGSVLL